jgi:hypothetical protein
VAAVTEGTPDTRPLFLRKRYPRPGEEEDNRHFIFQKLYPRPTGAQPGTTCPSAQPVSPRVLQARLEGLLRTVHAAPHGRRNDTLHWAACRVGELLTADALATVALATGLEPREVHGTIRSGFDRYGVSL